MPWPLSRAVGHRARLGTMPPVTALDAPARSAAPAPTEPAAAWLTERRHHVERADSLTAGWSARRAAGTTDAVEDFLFTYYPVRPSRLRRWHPGVGRSLVGPAEALADHRGWRWYESTPLDDDRVRVALDRTAMLAERGDSVRWIRGLLASTAARPAALGCLGLHEWAMVYRAGDGTRHPLPLRLRSAGTDAVVETHRIRCTHFDAFRFFTPPARPLNVLQPTPEDRGSNEQPGCLHANMDLLRHALKLGPAVPGDLLLDCFELARDVRELDMEASPYDVRSLGRGVVAIETAEGRAEYVERQRGFAERSEPLRARLLEVCDALLGSAEHGGAFEP